MEREEPERQKNCWLWVEGHLAERKRLNKRQWHKKKKEFNDHRVCAVVDLGEFKNLEKARPNPPSREEMVQDMDRYYRQRYQREMAIKAWDFQIAFFESKFNPEVYAKFLMDFQLPFSDFPEGECQKLGIKDNLEFFGQVAEKLEIFKKKK